MNYLNDKLADWRGFLEQVNPELAWASVPEDPLEIRAGDVVITDEYSSYQEGVLKFIFPMSLQAHIQQNIPIGPVLGELIDALAPKLDVVSTGVLEVAVDNLAEHWDSEEDINRFKRLTLALWHREKQSYETHWLHMAKLAWLMGFKTVQDFPKEANAAPDLNAPPIPLYQAMGYDKWSLFSKDILGIMPSQASQLKWTWQVYAIDLGWTEEKMARVGKSKLGLALGTLRRELLSPERNDAKIKQIAEDLVNDATTFATMLDSLQADRNGGMVVSFAKEPQFEPEVVRRWVNNKRDIPDMFHITAWVDSAPRPNAFTIVFNPELSPEELTAIKTKLDRAVHWNAKSINEVDVEMLQEDGLENEPEE